MTLVFALRGYLGGELFSGAIYTGPGVATELMALVLVLLLAIGFLVFEYVVL